MVEFCDECGSLMAPSDIDGKKMFKCKCGAVKLLLEEKSHSYRVKLQIQHPIEEEMQSTTEFMEWKEKYFQSEVSDFKCPSCNYDKASIKTKQMRGAHKGMIKYIVCLNCNRQIIIES